MELIYFGVFLELRILLQKILKRTYYKAIPGKVINVFLSIVSSFSNSNTKPMCREVQVWRMC